MCKLRKKAAWTLAAAHCWQRSRVFLWVFFSTFASVPWTAAERHKSRDDNCLTLLAFIQPCQLFPRPLRRASDTCKRLMQRRQLTTQFSSSSSSSSPSSGLALCFEFCLFSRTATLKGAGTSQTRLTRRERGSSINIGLHKSWQKTERTRQKLRAHRPNLTPARHCAAGQGFPCLFAVRNTRLRCDCPCFASPPERGTGAECIDLTSAQTVKL